MLGAGSDDVGGVEVHFGSSILEARSAVSMSATRNADGRTVRGGASIGLHDQEVGIAEPGMELAEPIRPSLPGRMLRAWVPFPLQAGLRSGSRTGCAKSRSSAG